MLNRFAELSLGVGLGLGYLTSFRLLGLVGASELLVLLSVLLMLQQNIKTVFSFKLSVEGYIKLYFLMMVLVFTPCITFVSFFAGGFGASVQPQYLLSFSLGVLLLFSLREAVKKGFSFGRMSLFFAITFIISNFIYIYFFSSGGEGLRYKGGADNPNQLLFYSWTLSLLLIVYHKKLAWVLIPLIVFIMLKTKSDAYLLSLVLVVVLYTYFKLFTLKKLGRRGRSILMVFTMIILMVTFLLTYLDDLVSLWLLADEGNARLTLMYNGFLAALQSPVLGWGTGSFSGLRAPFEGWEAHNTFIDLSMQFGFMFAVVIYSIFIAVFFKAISEEDYMIAAFIVGFIVSGLFHFSGRHFVFWVEIAVFLTYLGKQWGISVFYKVKEVDKCVVL